MLTVTTFCGQLIYAQHRTLEFDPDEWGGQRNIIADYVYMRVDEMYLLNAEANAKLDQDDAARDRLKELLVERITDFSYVDALSGQALEDEIYLQTRIELWGEGKSFLAAKRNKSTVTRGDNHLFFPGESFSYDSDELTNGRVPNKVHSVKDAIMKSFSR